MAHRFSDLSNQIGQLRLTSQPLFTSDVNNSFTIQREDNRRFTVLLRCSPDTANWKHLWSAKEYVEEFGRSVDKSKSSEIGWRNEPANFPFGPTFTLRLTTVEDATQVIGRVVSSYTNKLRALHELTEASLQSKVQNPRVERIIRSIEFPPEYHRSGITILSYFADVLRHKNLAEDVRVSIEQSGLNVSLVIESPTGEREMVERTLEAYALVVTGRQPIETLTTDPYEVAELKSQLSLANVQIETQRALLAAKNSEVSDLRAEVQGANTRRQFLIISSCPNLLTD